MIARIIRWSLLAALAAIIAGCAPDLEMASYDSLPAEIQATSPYVQQSYQFAMMNHEHLEYQPCYCGCNNIGHKNVYECFVAEEYADGSMQLDMHGAGCGICNNIVHDVMKGVQQGKSPQHIRVEIDASYSQYGESTDTPYPSN